MRAGHLGAVQDHAQRPHQLAGVDDSTLAVVLVQDPPQSQPHGAPPAPRLGAGVVTGSVLTDALPELSTGERIAPVALCALATAMPHTVLNDLGREPRPGGIPAPRPCRPGHGRQKACNPRPGRSGRRRWGSRWGSRAG